MKRIITIILILIVCGLVLWEVISWGTKTWTKYKLLREPLPSIATFLPTSMIQPLIMLTIISALAFATVSAILRSRKLFGLIPIEDLKRHVVVLGPTGSGKTTVVKAIIAKVLRTTNTKVVVIDWKGEYFLPGATIIRKIDIWKEIPGDTPKERALNAVEMLREMSRDVIEITPASSLLLLRVLEEEYNKGAPTTEKVLKILERSAEIAQREGRHAEANMYLALLRRLYLLLVDEERPAQNVEGDPQVVVYDLKSLPSIYLKNLYASFAITNVYRRAYASTNAGEKLRSLVVAEESQNYIRHRRPDEPPSMAERTVYELRSFGVGVILVCPDPTLLPEAVVRDVGTIVSLSPDTIPRFALERYLFRASLEEAEDVLKRLKKARMIVYFRGRLYFLRQLPKLPKVLKLKPKGPRGGRMGVTDSGVGSLRAWPILPHRSPGRPTVVEVKEEVTEGPKVVEVEEVKVEEKPRVLEVKVVEEKTEAESEAAEVEERPKDVEPLRLEEELEEPEAEVEVEKSPETIAEKEEKLEEPEPAPKGPPIPSSLPYRGSLCPAGRTATSGRAL
jgi:energy-coupling factor transporter ATP-binding protein EcfA2